MSGRKSNGPSGSNQRLFQWKSDLVEKPGPDPSNTGPNFSNCGVPAGLDWLQVSLFGEFDRDSWPRLLCDLDRARAIAEEKGESHSARLIDGHPLMVRAAGARHGGFYCRWVCRWAGVELHIVAGGQRSDNRPTCVAVLTSETLMEFGDQLAWERVKHLCQALGFSTVRDVVSRVDLALDLVDVDVDDFAAPFSAGCFIADAHKRAMYWDGRSTTGFTVGVGKCQLRVYEKVRELREKGSESKWASLVARWGKEPQKATRVEFQVRRDMLRERWDVGGVDDLWKKMPTIVNELCGGWFRMTDEKPKSNNHVRTSTLGLWRRVQEKFAKWAGDGPLMTFERMKPFIEPRKLIDQARGCVVSFMASLGWAGESWQDILGEAFAYLAEDGERIERDVRAKSIELIASGRMPVKVGVT